MIGQGQENRNTNLGEEGTEKKGVKISSVQDAKKIKELAHRPKSATTQELRKDQVQRTKLGPNGTKIKP